jgi:type I restriction enzyme, S subunit
MVAFPKCQSYKDSEVDWLGEIPEDWQTIRAKYVLKEIDERSSTGDEELLSVSHLTGVTPRSEKNVNMFLAEDYSGAKLCQPNDVVINTMWAWMGALGISPMKGLVSPAYGVYRPNEKVFPKFLDSLLRTPQYIAEYIRRSTGIHSSRLRLYPNQFLDIPLLLPPIEKQKKIVDFLDCKTAEIDQAIAQKQRLIELLQEQKAILINQAVTKGLNPNVIMRDSDIDWIGKIPAHWRFPKLKYACRVIKDGLHLTPCKHNIGVNFISTQHVRNRKITLDQATYISEKDYKLGHPKIKPEVGDVLITLVGSIGFAALVASDHMPLSCTRHVGYVRCREDLIKQEYLINYTESNVFKCFIEENVSQTAQPSIYLASLANHQLPLPPLSEQKEINGWLSKSITSLLKTIDIILSEISILHELKQIYITEAVTGKIKV